VVYPTETVWGLGGRAGDGASALRLARLKGRERLPLIVLVAGPVPGLPPLAASLAAALWPGPLTLVVPGALVPGVAPEVLAEDGTVGIRWSPHPVVAALIAAVGPLTSTSANRHGAPPVLRVTDLDLAVDAVVPGRPGGQDPSSVVHGRTGKTLRPGAADAAIARALADLESRG
jgi:L-threonylcarbamoyladenylate synthase